MKIETHLNKRRSQRAATLDARLAVIDGFISQTADRTLLSELRVLRARIVKGPKCCGKHSKEARARAAALSQDKQDKSRAEAKNGGASWSADDDRLIFESPLKDEEIAALIGRSIKAITRRRSKLRRLMPN